MHIVNRLGYVINSTQETTTVDKKPIIGKKIHSILTYPSEADVVKNIINDVLKTHRARYCTYTIDGLDFISLIFPAPGLRNIVEVHECGYGSWSQRKIALRLLEQKCKERFHGPGCSLKNGTNKK